MSAPMSQQSSYRLSHAVGFAGTNILFAGPICWLWYGVLDTITALGLVILGAGMMVLGAARIDWSTPLEPTDHAFAGRKPQRQKSSRADGP
jgi:hypothetical protein